MHGRLKVKTTLEQQEAKNKEREKKLQLYVSATQAAFNKRKAGQLDKEALELTAQILALNPDFASLWNLRREVFFAFAADRSDEEMGSLYVAELSFLESCLRVNPKSYGTWYHRCWIMQHMPEPDWSRELTLCNRFLEIDERNFHCWDYRRFVTHSFHVPHSEELEFTSSLITKNFSNYSSWHYRSKLLPQIHPDPQHLGRATEDVLLSELELVQNAFFTDPNDQSAWFYNRWLLGRADLPLSIRCISVDVVGSWVSVTFTHPVLISILIVLCEIHAPYTSRRLAQSDLILFIDEKPVMVTWRTSDGKAKPSLLWVCEFPKERLSDKCQHKFKVIWKDGEAQKECVLYPGKQSTWFRDSASEDKIFSLELSEGKSNVLQQELQSCKELQELEPENKWCLLTIILLMRALDPLLYEKESLCYFNTLKVVDPMRSGYYDDLRSKFQIENAILKMEYAEANVIIVSHKDLTRLYHLDHLLLTSHMCLSNNKLRSLPSDFSMLRYIEVLEVDNNEISHLEGVWNLPRLEELSLQFNKIENVLNLQALCSCPRLSVLRLQENPICETADAEDKLRALLPHVSLIEI
ncbi:geranylgeranyl transferase type-2 subunit alpha isoform X2 [Bufo gargarizans]|uniref:geranylgeranyl transferase type-2 subunit alpha isoform X2 n=1 Tax=Bufo gargarizans TaxID=30331 RepID=UPI001CF1CB6C|nr:geranylgeranyl transferase type-2 subunit alpha isoform X2 [Bufo gargarizans]XP_044129188.1 geranylgeranyl transferase type-2 subunit alpha isoform X2 [Bufo gargarizans]XP_044129197.1 geranylgeranyl transferase type-2 subunit alpha isoform X2 [Bufo gargarizans]XP_044129201.1 geranylgeranyl transferase type-2 subunit alpha isoform X2 [Bufo gargarizans]XP_044129208.1 geranylgeranyl transferase type-2 subunit alpha isoform X2 [Bufo gargarizans]